MTTSEVPSATAVARAAVTTALTLDRTSTRLIQRTEARVARAQSEFDAVSNAPDFPTVSAAAIALQVAIGAGVFATHYQTSCRAILATTLDELAGSGASHADGPGPAAG